jgi:hypothetical protein
MMNTPRAIASGLAAGSAYLATAWADSKLSSHPYNDLKLVGQMVTTRSPYWQIQGLAGHFGFSVVMSLLYARHFYKKLPGPPVVRGITFLQLENTLLYPVAPLLDSFHAGVGAREIPPLLSKKSFQGQVLRHIAFGAALGLLYREK